MGYFASLLSLIIMLATSSAGYCRQDIPYAEKDRSAPKATYGAACLSMVYRSYGKKIPERDIIDDIAVAGHKGRVFSSLSKECLNAEKNGLYAVSIKARHPEDLLELFQNNWDDTHPRIMFIQRPQGGAGSGHPTVLVDAAYGEITVNDPSDKPLIHIDRGLFLSLWAKDYVMTAFSDRRSGISACRLCGRDIPDHIICPRCRKQVGLQPKEVIGCVYDDCPRRLWDDILCPYCNKYFSEPVKSEVTASGRPSLKVPHILQVQGTQK